MRLYIINLRIMVVTLGEVSFPEVWKKVQYKTVKLKVNHGYRLCQSPQLSSYLCTAPPQFPLGQWVCYAVHEFEFVPRFAGLEGLSVEKID